MITLPAQTLRQATLNPESTPDSVAESRTAAGSIPQPQAFLALLDQRMLALSAAGDALQGAASATKGQLRPGDSRTANIASVAILAADTRPQALSALLAQPQQATAAERASARPARPGDEDSATLAALNAMLCGQLLLPPQRAQVAPANSTDSTDSTQGSITPDALPGQMSNAVDKTTGTRLLAPTSAPDRDMALSDNGTALPAPAENGAFQPLINSAQDHEGSAPPSAPGIASADITQAASLFTPSAAPVTATAAAPQLNAPLGSAEWQQALGQQILMFSRNGQQSAELHLHPQDLGSIQISLQLDKDQAQVNMVAHHGQVRAALESALPQLRAALAENGISLGQSNVSGDAFPQSQAFGGQQQQQRHQHDAPFSPPEENSAESTPIAVPASLQARAAGGGGVDIFA